MNINNIANISEVITYQSKINPDKKAILFLEKSITYLELENLIWKTSNFLYEKEIRSKDIVAIESEDEFFIIIMMLSLARIGATSISISVNISSFLRTKIVKELNIKYFFDEKKINFDDLESNINLLNKNILSKDSKLPWLLLIGSGSTGKKKILPITHTEQIFRMKISSEWLESNTEDKIATLVHMNFYIAKMLYLETFYSGATVVLLNKKKLNIKEIYENYNITILHATVFHIGKLLDLSYKKKSLLLPMLKRLYVGGSIVTNFIRDEILKRINPNLTIRYGINEVGTISKIDCDKGGEKLSIGKPIDSLDVQIVDDQKNILPIGRIGQIRIKSKGMINEYLNDDNSTKNTFIEGWFYPNDLGKIIDNGELIHMGRADQMMIRNGINIFPIEIEQIVIKHESVLDVAVLSLNSIIHQDIPICAVVLRDGFIVNEKVLMKYCIERLGSSAPSRVVILDLIPRNEQGKLLSLELKKKIENRLGNNKKNDTSVKEILVNYAKSIDIPILKLINDRDYIQFGWGKNSVLFNMSSPFKDSYNGVKISMDKEKSKRLLKNIGLPIAKSKTIKTIDELELASKIVGFPSVVKPIRGAAGKGITTNIRDFDDLKKAFIFAKKSDFGQSPIMIEEHHEGEDFRIIVAYGKFLSAIKRTPASVIGNGKNKIKELIFNLNNYRKESLSLKAIELDNKLKSHLKRLNLNFDSILKENEKIFLSSVANLVNGGEAEDATSLVHPSLKKMVENLSRVTKIAILGVDYITTDISKPFYETKGVITEFNHYINLASADFFYDRKIFFKKLFGILPSRVPFFILVVDDINIQKQIIKFLRNNIKDKGIGFFNYDELYVDDLKLDSLNSNFISKIEILLRQSNLEKGIVICNQEELFFKKFPLDKVEGVYTFNNKIINLKKKINFKTFESKNFKDLEKLLEYSLEKLAINFKNVNTSYFNSIRNLETFELTINKKNIPSSLNQIDKWFEEVLKIDLHFTNISTLIINKIVNRILLLSLKLFQLISIPIFDIGEVKNRFYNHKTNIFTIEVNLELIDYIEKRVFLDILKLSQKIVLELFIKPIDSKTIQRVYNFMNINIISPYKGVSGSGKSTIPILKEAFKQNIPFMHLGSGVYQLGWGYKSKRMDRSTTGFDSAIGAKLAQNKILTTNLLRDAGLPAPQNKLVTRKKDALTIALELGFPVVVKPSDQDRGEGITININDKESLYYAFDIAKKLSKSKKVIIEKQVAGICHRIFIANGKILYAVKRLPKGVYSDGKNTIRKIIENENEKERLSPPWLKTRMFPMDNIALSYIEKSGFTVNDIPEKGIFIPLRDIESTKWGGTDEDVTKSIHETNIDIAIKSASLFGLHVAGVDIISSDISRPYNENRAIINEINFSPLFGGGEISRNAIPKFLKEFISDSGRIPIHMIESFDDANIMLEEKKNQGINCFLIEDTKDLKKRIKALLLNPLVEEIIVVANEKK